MNGQSVTQKPIAKFEKEGDTVTGSLIGILKSRMGYLLELDQVLIALNVNLHSMILEIADSLHEGDIICATYKGIQKSKAGFNVKLYTLSVNGKEVPSGLFRKSSFQELKEDAAQGDLPF